VVRCCSLLGATFIKVGQILSARRDLIPAPLAAELAALQDQVPPFPFAAVRNTIEEDLGAPLEELFSEFETEPVAAASVAQVHRAVWKKSGAVVAVKVRRPDVLRKIGLDRAVLVTLASWAERLVPSLRLVSLRKATEQFCNAVEQQAHLVLEAEHNRRFRANFAGDRDVVFPELIAEACSDRVLTMEYIEGEREEALDDPRFDRRRIVEAGVRCVGRMIFQHGFVHADLHPGNLRFVPPHRIAIFDLGLVGELSDTDRLMTARTLWAFATGDGKTVARLFYENAPFQAVPDYAAYEAEVMALVEELRRRQLGSSEVSLDIGRIFDVLRRHRVQARAHMTMINLALVTAEGLGKRLDPTLNLAEAALPYILEALRGAEVTQSSSSAGGAGL
jgi:ubiquinone biosynthesis protein